MLNDSGSLLDGSMLGASAPLAPIRLRSSVICVAIATSRLAPIARRLPSAGSASAVGVSTMKHKVRIYLTGSAGAVSLSVLSSCHLSNLYSHAVFTGDGACAIKRGVHVQSGGSCQAVAITRLRKKKRTVMRGVCATQSTMTLSKSNSDPAPYERTLVVMDGARTMVVPGGR